MLRTSFLRRCAPASAGAAVASTISSTAATVSASAETQQSQQQQQQQQQQEEEGQLFATASDRDIAFRLKVGVNEVLAKYNNVPPELFIRRARAYETLGHPYFALADYSMASESVQVDKEHVTQLMRETAALPNEIRLSYPGTNKHLGWQVVPYLAEGVAVDECCGEHIGGGRALRAVKDIPTSSVVVKRHSPWLTYPSMEGICANCGCVIGAQRRIVPCRNPDCHEEYCSRECRSTALTTYHSGTCNNSVFQSLELELYSKFKSADSRTAQNEAALHLLALRVISAGLTVHMKPSSLAEVQTLSGTMLANPVQIATTTHEFHYRLCRAANIRMSLSLEEFLCIMCKIQSNLFSDENYFYLSMPRSMMNHSCDPNCSELGGQIVALRPIKESEELTISYFPALVGINRETRLQELKRRGFECRCALCMSGK